MVTALWIKVHFFPKKQSFWVENLFLVKSGENFFLLDF